MDAPGPVLRRPTTDFAELTDRVRQLGLLEPRRSAYVLRFSVSLAALAAVVAVVVLLGDTWWQLGLAALLGVVTSQFGFLSHDAAHRQVFRGGRANQWAARLLSTTVVGLSYGWWMHKHNRHHRSPNEVGRDPDIAPGGLVFTVEDAGRRRGVVGAVTRHQGLLFFPMLLLEGANLHWSSIQTLVVRTDLPHRWTELTLLTTRLVVPPVALLLVMSPLRVAAFVVVEVAVFGFLLGAAFAPNHKGRPLIPRGSGLDFIGRQVLASRNIAGGWVVDTVMGGLNHQIEHHLFPSMARDNLRHARPVVQQFCRDRGLDYTETSLVESYRIVVRHLNEVGIGARDPFACPFVTENRG